MTIMSECNLVLFILEFLLTRTERSSTVCVYIPSHQTKLPEQLKVYRLSI